MKGDFSRDTFDPAKRYSRVLQQQGRVQLDADWNEQGAILLHQLRTMARDLIGAHGAPAAAPGFEIIADPFDKRLPKEVAATLKPGGFLIGPGRYYVDGVLVENDRYLPYHRQTGFPFADGTDPDTLKDTRHSMLVYLDVWERLVTAAEDPAIAATADSQFHMAIARATRNDYYARFVEFLGVRLVPPSSLYLKYQPERSHDAYTHKVSDEHDAVLDAIVRMDIEKARHAARHHMQESLLRHSELNDLISRDE